MSLIIAPSNMIKLLKYICQFHSISKYQYRWKGIHHTYSSLAEPTIAIIHYHHLLARNHVLKGQWL